MFPLARSDTLTVRELPDETVVYDLETNKVHCLNRPAALVWKHCDGVTSLDQLAELLDRELQIASPKQVLHLSLEQLSRRRLLQTPVPPLTESARMGRREALKKLVAAAVALPVIMTITAPKALAQSSVVSLCISDSDCPSANPCSIGKCSQTSSGNTIIFACVFSAAPVGTPCGAGRTCSTNSVCV